MKKLDLKESDIKALMIKYMLPSVAGMLGLSMCIFFDTMFIGQGIGDLGLAALNIVIPVFSIFTSVYLLIGIGGATVISISIGRKRYKDISGIFTLCMSAGAIIGIILIVLRILFLDKIVLMFGATDEIIPLAKDYLGIVLVAGIGFIINGSLNVFVRNDGAPKLSMWSTIGANVTNIILDYIFIFPMGMGMKGAAIATSFSSVTGIIILLIHFRDEKNNLRISFNNLPFSKIKRILKNGSPSFIAEISGGIVIFTFNIVISKILGNIGVSAYSIVCNSALIVLAIFNGISQGIQPIVGVNYGAELMDRVKRVFKITNIIVIAVGGFFYLIGFLKPDLIIGIFSKGNEEIVNITTIGISIYFLSLIPMGLNIIYIGFMQSIEEVKYSGILSVLRGLILSILLVVVLSKFFGVIGFWLAIPCTEMLTFIIAIRFIKSLRNINV